MVSFLPFQLVKNQNLAWIGHSQVIEFHTRAAYSDFFLSMLHCLGAENAITDQKAETSLDSWSVHSNVTRYHKDGQQIEPTSKERQQYPLLKSESKCHALSNPKTNKSREKRHNALHHGKKSPMRNHRLMETPSYGVLDHDILLDLPSNLSFQQAELIHQPVWNCKPQPTNTERAPKQKNDNNVLVEDVLVENEPDLEWTGLLWNSPSSGSVSHSLY